MKYVCPTCHGMNLRVVVSSTAELIQDGDDIQTVDAPGGPDHSWDNDSVMWCADCNFSDDAIEFDRMEEENLIAEANALDAAYTDAAAFDSKMQAEAYDKDLRALVEAARAVLSRNHRGGDTTTERALRDALEAFEPWLEGADDNDPRAMGWVDDKGRP